MQLFKMYKKHNKEEVSINEFLQQNKEYSIQSLVIDDEYVYVVYNTSRKIL